MSDDPTDIPSLEARVIAMRRLGVLEWGSIKLGPEPTIPSSEEDATQRSLKLEKQERERRNALRLAASGGPRPAGART